MDFSLFLPNLAKIWSKYWKLFLITGLENTLILTIISVSLGTVLGTLVAMLKMSRLRVARFISSVYVEVIRGTPILLQLYVFYFVLPNVFTFMKLSPSPCASTRPPMSPRSSGPASRPWTRGRPRPPAPWV